MMTRRIALKLQYLGSAFSGWQRQSRHASVQAALEESLSSRAGHGVVVHGAGRTDAGVHAAGQVAHFDTSSPIPVNRWPLVLNNCLPPEIAIVAAAEVSSEWHARFSASFRRYRYLLLNQEQRDVFWSPFSWHYRIPLDVNLMATALESILGSHDLEVFRRAGSPRPHSWVTVQAVSCQRQGNLISIEAQASGFLYRMMRLLVGALVFVGRSELSPVAFKTMWQTKDLSVMPSRLSVPPQGLCLTAVGYPEDPFWIHCSESLSSLFQGWPPFSPPEILVG